jgi:hypothetical protein
MSIHSGKRICYVCNNSIVKVKGHCITWHEGTDGEQRYSSTISLASALDGVGGQCHTPAALTPGMTRYSLCTRLGRPQGRSGRVLKISSPPQFDPRTVQSVANRDAHCAGEGGEYDSHCTKRNEYTPVRTQLCTWGSTKLLCHPWRDGFVLLTASSASSHSVATVRVCPVTSAVHSR